MKNFLPGEIQLGGRLRGITVSKSNIPAVMRYIKGQREHHRKRTFQDEYRELLRLSGIDYDERYIWG
ncbi:MAG TPA: hypothetical protein VIR01_01315 [Pyrinomonadaceae bacterium]